jgi:hypothetical protein
MPPPARWHLAVPFAGHIFGADMKHQRPMLDSNFRFPGVLNSQEILVAEAIQARAWAALGRDGMIHVEPEAQARDRLGRIVVQMLTESSTSISDLAAAAVEKFKASIPTSRDKRSAL